ncbi:MAG: hypothetical protein HUJ54_12210 [Erysipelotrichaceae bacterium]|nr:hypothetical protein [Erysipelotrichaceae bacterium]
MSNKGRRKAGCSEDPKEGKSDSLNGFMKTDRNQTNDPIAAFLTDVKFKKKLFGGVNEQDVWKKIDQLNELYKAELRAERARFDLLLKEQSEAADRKEQKGSAGL